MKFLSTIVAAIIVGLVSTNVYAEDYNFKPGLWEITTLTEIIDTSTKIPPQTEQECIKGTDFMYESDGECKYENQRVNAKKMLINMICTVPEGIFKGTGETIFNGKTFSGWINSDMLGGPSGPMKTKITFNGKYLGACN